MSFSSSVAKFSAMTVLSGSGVQKIKSFTLDGHTFNPTTLAMMASEISNDYLHVQYSSGMNGKAIYNSTENTLYLGFMSAGSLSRQALIVHEVTHAMFDFQAKQMDVATSESLAYIAQCQYARANSDDPEARLYSEDDAKDKVFEVGWNIAGKLLGGGTLSSSDVSDMRAAVSGHPYYAANATAGAGFDGY